MNGDSYLDDSIDPFSDTPKENPYLQTPSSYKSSFPESTSEPPLPRDYSESPNTEDAVDQIGSKDYGDFQYQGRPPVKSTTEPRHEAPDSKIPDPSKSEFLNITIKSTTINQVKKSIPSYRFDVSTNIKTFRRQRYFGVERTHIEFERLAKHLAITYTQCLVISFPSQPSSSSLKDPKMDSKSTTELDSFVIYFVQLWMDWVSSHSILRHDYELRNFVETPFAVEVSFNGEKTRAEIDYDLYSEPSKKSLFFSGWSSKPSQVLNLNSQTSNSASNDGQSVSRNRSTSSSNSTQTFNNNPSTDSSLGSANANNGQSFRIESEFEKFLQESNETSGPLSLAKKEFYNLALQRNILGGHIQEMASRLVGLGNLELTSSKKLFSRKEISSNSTAINENTTGKRDESSIRVSKLEFGKSTTNHNQRYGDSSFLALGHMSNSTSIIQYDISMVEATLPPLFLSNFEKFNRDVKRSLANRMQLFDDLKLARLNLERKKQAITVLRSSSTIVPKHVDETLSKMDTAKSEEFPNQEEDSCEDADEELDQPQSSP
ncbi:Vacuolar protein sorting-associated protein 17 [Smittium mucronatum]|uniref:Vacuolar protein sorting-associated protein 17 n=1 Tax=Smittium mucronatum TaxID=133383 RepID=A0A1R0H2P6_9FUNG|nr:Vacuolar protein sorting-associated protein 17 [Smittium mucronatum]